VSVLKPLLGLLLVSSLSSLSGCGDQLVEFPLDGSSGGMDASGDADLGDADLGGPPTVIATSPAPAQAGVTVNRRVRATFSRPMDPATITDLTFTLLQDTTPVAGDVSYQGSAATFTPLRPLDLSLEYTAVITTGARDLQGTALAADHAWAFTTGACSLEPIDLRSAGAFAVLAGSTVTSTGPTALGGDLGVSPGTAVTGFPPGTLAGGIHAGDPISADATDDLTIAYNDAAARVLCPVTVAGNLGGQTLAPGLYKSTSSLEITSGDLTLDAGGEEDAIFIFQTASTLTTTAGRQVILAGGARSTNIYWQIGSAATLGTSSSFEGTLMADQAITLGTGATLNGRALARIAAVSLDSNPITMPAP
jgi:ice-binding like protein/Big-like domain-containing protein